MWLLKRWHFLSFKSLKEMCKFGLLAGKVNFCTVQKEYEK